MSAPSDVWSPERRAGSNRRDLRTLCARFAKRTDELSNFAITTTAILDESVARLWDNPTTQLAVAITDSNGVRSHTSVSSAFDVLPLYQRHAHYLLEMVHNRLVADFYDALTETFAVIVAADTSGSQPCPPVAAAMASKQLKSRARRTDAPLTDEEAVERFGWLGWHEKMTMLVPLTDAQLDEFVFCRVKQSTFVRNILEHHDGWLSAAQLSNHGTETVGVLDAKGDERDFACGERLEIGLFEVMRVARVLDQALKQITGTWCHPAE